MLSCPRCQATLEPTALQCPRCSLPLKAHGHPGIPLHRTEGDEPLCATCLYDADDTCNFPQRPHAETCTLYRSIKAAEELAMPPLSLGEQIGFWLRNHRGVVGLLGLLLLSLVVVLVS
ncbi:hypothetical protein IQ265_01400 [Nodosilinea sp. LEGE 06152]|uniref:hypothetical protein n=1 Tax=Nodosilinea sp. LEGE 06152 TaxID=2777966 RepID=UPI001880EAB3|nr:hypothetical protein [Nodosilinea sp. LEGE 06152]MBE9155500.1 hypothetical protein [Nodosilinea sp. LEGE 06152]